MALDLSVVLIRGSWKAKETSADVFVSAYVILNSFISFKVHPYVLYMTLERHLLCDSIMGMLMRVINIGTGTLMFSLFRAAICAKVLMQMVENICISKQLRFRRFTVLLFKLISRNGGHTAHTISFQY